MKKIYFLVVMLVMVSGISWGQIVAWQFGSPAALGTEVTYNATTNNANLNTSVLSRGSGIAPTALGRGFASNGFDNGATKASAITNNEYYQFAVSAQTGFQFSLSTLDVRLRRSGTTAPNMFIWRYSLDGTNFTDIGTDISFTSTADGVDQTQISLAGISALQNVVSGTTATFRLYAWGGTSTTATFSIGRYGTGVTTNSLSIGGTVTATGGLTPPTISPDVTNNDVDNNIDITFTDDATWRSLVTAVKIGSTTLTATTDYELTAGNLRLKPSGLNTLLTTAGSKSVSVEATGYNPATVTQVINVGAPAKLAMKTQPGAPAANGGVLAPQPAVFIQDQYGNTTTSTATVDASVGAGTWTLGGTTSVAGIAGTTTYSGLTATSASAVTGATISFSSTGLTGVTSGTFDIPAPIPAIVLSPASPATLNNFTYSQGAGPSTEKTFTVSGLNLTNNIGIAATTNYEISLTSGGDFTNPSLTLTPTSGSVATTTIYVRLKAGLTQGVYNGEVINITSTGATSATVTCNGDVTVAVPTLPLYEEFSYSAGTLLTANGWSAHSGGGTNPITVAASSITYPGYLSSGTGNEVTMTTNGEDVNKAFVGQTSGTVYTSFLVNVSSATTTGDYFFNVGQTTIGTTFKGRLYVKADASNNLSFGISQTTSTANYTPFIYSLNTTYLIVLKYDIVSGTSNDVASIYINPTLNAPIPSTGWIANTDGAGTDLSELGSVALRQGATANAPTLKLDGIRISTVWADIVGPPIPTVSSFTPTSGYRGSTVVITGTDFTGATSVKFGGTEASSFTVDNATQITATVAAGATGTVSVTNANGTGTSASSFTFNGYITNTSGNWSDGSTWLGGVVPATTDNTTIDAAHTVSTNATVTRDAGTTTTVNGSFQINQGGWATGAGTWTYGTVGTLVFNNSSGSYGVNNDVFWPATNGPVNVTVQNNGGITMNVARTVSGLFQTAKGVINANNLTLNGTAQLNAGGYFTGRPIYGSSSTLKYNTGGTYGRGDEFYCSGGAGCPNNVLITNNTELNVPNGVPFANGQIQGNLTIDAGSAMYMDYGGVGQNWVIEVYKDVVLNGSLSLGDAVGGDLYVGGNWTKGAAATFNPNGRAVRFNGTADQTITGETTFSYLTLNKSGNLLLANNVSVNNTLTLNSGKIVLGANDLSLLNAAPSSLSAGSATSYVVTDGAGALRRAIGTLYNGDYFFPVGNTSNRQLATVNFGSISANNTLAARFIAGASGNAGLPLTEGENIARTASDGYWEINAASATGDTYTGTFVANGFTDITDFTKVHLLKRADAVSAWTLNGTHVTTTGSNALASLQRTGMSGFSQFAVGGESLISLPSVMLTFSGQKQGSVNKLNWTTVSEQNNRGFAVERSADGVNYAAIGFVNSLAVNGNSDASLTYSFTDANPTGSKQYYRLRQQDINGVSRLSNVIVIKGEKVNTLTIDGLYPNPVSSQLNVAVSSPVRGTVTLQVVDMTGRILSQQVKAIAEGSNTVSLNVDGLSNGSYILKVVNAETGAVSAKFSKQ